MTATTHEHPILFSAPMVRALLAGTKTQTRRVVKPQPTPPCSHVEPFRGEGGGWIAGDNTGRIFRCPYGERRGDRLWVRETWAPVDFLFDGYDRDDPTHIGYAADRTVLLHEGGQQTALDTYALAWNRAKWKPSIFMPRWASRLTLEITEIRVQRLQEISEEDARAEGVEPAVCGEGDPPNFVKPRSHRAGFVRPWGFINGKRPGRAWADSPWVWCVSFRRMEQKP